MRNETIQPEAGAAPDTQVRSFASFSFLAVLLAPLPFLAFGAIVNFIRRVIAPGVPVWAAATVALVICSSTALLIFGILRRRPTAQAGWCRVCEYCLQGNTSGVCPECGTAIKSARRRTEPGFAGVRHDPQRKRTARPT
jgi:hypothetical protein